MSNYQIDRDKWRRLSIFDQMGNIYVEVGRTFMAKQAGDTQRAAAAEARALDLLDATAEVLAMQKSPKLKEVQQTRQVFVREIAESQESSLDDYLMQFAVAARMRHNK